MFSVITNKLQSNHLILVFLKSKEKKNIVWHSVDYFHDKFWTVIDGYMICYLNFVHYEVSKNFTRWF